MSGRGARGRAVARLGLKIGDDPGVTRVGRVLRRTSLDELRAFSACCADR
jgi:lipopolysaccharide/colanic/teichoic acid biosynthesis glycosyltransferase